MTPRPDTESQYGHAYREAVQKATDNYCQTCLGNGGLASGVLERGGNVEYMRHHIAMCTECEGSGLRRAAELTGGGS